MVLSTRQQKFRITALAPLFFVLVPAAHEESLTLAPPKQIAPAENTVETIEVGVTAPEAFSIKDMALWDGHFPPKHWKLC
ncbi:MAG: hypothetical protein ABGW81_07180 [Paracoccaceae bacterium]